MLGIEWIIQNRKKAREVIMGTLHSPPLQESVSSRDHGIVTHGGGVRRQRSVVAISPNQMIIFESSKSITTKGL